MNWLVSVLYYSPAFRKAEVFLIPDEKNVRASNEPVKLLQPNVHLVAQPVGVADSSGSISNQQFGACPLTITPRKIVQTLLYRIMPATLRPVTARILGASVPR